MFYWVALLSIEPKDNFWTSAVGNFGTSILRLNFEGAVLSRTEDDDCTFSDGGLY